MWGSPSDAALRLAPCPPAETCVVFLRLTGLPRLPLYLRQPQSHIGRAWVEVARRECAIRAKPARALGTAGVSKGGGGVINSPKTNQNLMPPEDMEPSAPSALAGICAKQKTCANGYIYKRFKKAA